MKIKERKKNARLALFRRGIHGKDLPRQPSLTQKAQMKEATTLAMMESPLGQAYLRSKAEQSVVRRDSLLP